MATFTLTKYRRREDGARVWAEEPTVTEGSMGTVLELAHAARDEAAGCGFAVSDSGIVGTTAHTWLRHSDGRQIHITYTTR